MKTSATGRHLVEQFEGLILGAYDDYNDHIVQPGDTVRGTLTIGYGHTNSAGGPRVSIGQTITKFEADQLLAQDLGRVEADVTRLVKVVLNQNQFDALVSFQYNTGALGKSSILKSLNAGDYKDAANRLTLYNRGNGQVLAGLTRRREAEKALFLKPMSAKPTLTGAVVAAGGTAVAVTQAPPHLIPYLIVGSIIAGIIGYILYRKYHDSKVHTNVGNNQEPVPVAPEQVA